MNKKFNKIHIIGASGSGKTTFAKKLSQLLELPHFDLDDIRYPPSINKKRSYEERIPEVLDLAKKDRWLVEGIYTNSWVKELLKNADQIIWLDLPIRLTLPRLFKRYLKQKITGKDRYGFKSFLKMIRWSIHYHYPDPKFDLSDEDRHITRKKSEAILKIYENKLIRIRSLKELDHYLSNWNKI